MRRRRILRELAALGYPEHIPDDATRARVRAHAMNRTPHETIAECLEIPVGVLRYYYNRELSLTDAEVLAGATLNMLELATQRKDLGVALRANETILRTRSPVWREPKAVEPAAIDDLVGVNIDRMTLEQVETALARIRGTAARAGADDPAHEGDPD